MTGGDVNQMAKGFRRRPDLHRASKEKKKQKEEQPRKDSNLE